MPKLADAAPPDRFGFVTVAANRFDTITVPLGYNCYVVARWGDPLWSGAPPFDPINRGTGASQERALGDNCDGMILFRNKEKNILAVNNEFVNRFNIYANRWSKLAENADDAHLWLVNSCTVKDPSQARRSFSCCEPPRADAVGR